MVPKPEIITPPSPALECEFDINAMKGPFATIVGAMMNLPLLIDNDEPSLVVDISDRKVELSMPTFSTVTKY